MRRFVVDASTLVSGCVDPHGESPPCLIYRNLSGSRFESIICPEVLGEVADALHKPYFLRRIDDADIGDIITGIAEASTILEDPAQVTPLLRDPDDDYLVTLARTAEAEAIITGDRDLLDHPGLQPPAIDARTACELIGLTAPDQQA